MFFKRKNKEKAVSRTIFGYAEIGANEDLKLIGLNEIRGDIGDGTKIKITDGGGLLVRGNIGDNVEIIVEGKKKKSASIIIKSGGKPYDEKKFNGCVIVEGRCGDHVSIEAPLDIHIQDAGDHFMGTAGFDFTAANLGDHSWIDAKLDIDIKNGGTRTILVAGHEVTAKNIGENSEITSGLDMELHDVGAHSELEAGHDLTARSVGENSTLKSGLDMDVHTLGHACKAVSGHDYTGNLIGQKCHVKAGLDLEVKKAFNNATLKSAFDPEVDKYLDPSQDKTAPTKKKAPPNNFDII
ncbi:MAG: hypothetical protein VX803_03375, partial [Pseudomonadota bacterium]|nr:hypothetical protein [Pseudomonadota bacterium]